MKTDKKCIPYPAKGTYWIITIPYLALLIVTTLYLWTYSIPVAIIYVLVYIASVVLHGYICSLSSCPYKGTLCPGAFGWFPVGKLAAWFGRRGKNSSVKPVSALFPLIMLTLLCILVLPLYWINKAGWGFSLGYVALILVHFFFFVLKVCPKCAMRTTCPTAKLSNSLNKAIFKKEIA